MQYEEAAALAKMAAQAARRAVDVVWAKKLWRFSEECKAAAGTLNGSQVPDIGPEPYSPS